MPLPPDVQAMVQGSQRGAASAFQGQMPSGTNVGGAPPQNYDPAAPLFDSAFAILSRLQAYLFQIRQEEDANKVHKMANEVSRLKLDRQKKIAQTTADQMTGKTSPIAPVGNISALGVPTQR